MKYALALYAFAAFSHLVWQWPTMADDPPLWYVALAAVLWPLWTMGLVVFAALAAVEDWREHRKAAAGTAGGENG